MFNPDELASKIEYTRLYLHNLTYIVTELTLTVNADAELTVR